MSEVPDFEKVARRVVELMDGQLRAPFIPIDDDQVAEGLARTIAEQLRLIWNARGAADIARLDAELSTLLGATAAAPYLKSLDGALRTLDR